MMRYDVGRVIIRARYGRYGDERLNDLISELKFYLNILDINATMRLYNSIYKSNGQIIIDVPYAYFVEVGTVPHLTPIGPLIKWAKAKFNVDDKRAKNIAYAVRNKIMMFGTRRHPFITNALNMVGLEIVSKEYLGNTTIIYVRLKNRQKITETR